MLQEIKYRLLEIYLTQKKKLALFACLVFVGLFVVSQSIHAFALDLANVQLDALDFIDNSVLKYLVLVALLAIESLTLLNISARLLDWSSRLPVALSDNPLVDAGWHFTSGLANISFILIFVVIALAYVFKLETFGMKKALPRLIIVTLLINFSLLFVRMLSDIGWIFQNSFSSVFFKEGSGLAETAASALSASTLSLLPVIIGVPLAYMAVAWIPYVNVAALMAIGALVLATGGGALLGTISQVIMVIVFNFTVGFIFLVFAALFLVRIAAIWILAIFAPLAFMAFILPHTKKYFDQWMKSLIQWILLGVVVYFLVGLGLMLFGLVAPGGGQEIQFSGELGKWKFFDTFYKYIFLVIYMLVVFSASRKLVPIGTQMIWGLGEKAVMGSQKRAAGLSRRVGIGAKIWGQEGVARAGQRLEELKGKETLTGRERIAKGWWTVRKMGRSPELAKAEVQNLKAMQMAKIKEETLKKLPKDPEDRRAALDAALLRLKQDDPLGLKRTINRPKIAAIEDLMAREGKIGEIGEEFLADAIKGGANADKIRERRPDLAQTIMEAADPTKFKKIQEDLRTELSKQNLSSQELQKKLNEETREKLIKEVMEKMNPEDLGKRMQAEAAKSAQVVEQILRDPTKLNYFGRNAKLETKRQISETIKKHPQTFNQSPLREQVYYMTQSPRWPLEWKESEGKTTSGSKSAPPARPGRASRPGRK